MVNNDVTVDSESVDGPGLARRISLLRPFDMLRAQDSARTALCVCVQHWLVCACVVGLSVCSPQLAVAGKPVVGDSTMDALCPERAKWIKARVKTHADGNESGPNAHKAVVNPGLRAELLQMAEADQAVRRALRGPVDDQYAARKRMLSDDAKNLKRMRQIVAEVGFPTTSLVGSEGVSAAWLLVQHAANDPDFQAHMLQAMQPLVESGEISGEQFASLTDRVLVLHEHKKQRYGTQLYGYGSKATPLPIADPEHVDQHREKLQMMPLAYYLCFADAMKAQRRSSTD